MNKNTDTESLRNKILNIANKGWHILCQILTYLIVGSIIAVIGYCLFVLGPQKEDKIKNFCHGTTYDLEDFDLCMENMHEEPTDNINI